MANLSKISRKEKVFYGMGNLGYGVVSQTYTNFIMFFGTAVWGIPGTLMGIAIAISVFWDAITDPIIGHFSDREKSRFFGKRHGFMLIGVIGMAVVNIILWAVPSGLDTTSKFMWLLVSMLALETFNTMFATPYTALGTELSDDYNERTNIQAYKTAFFLLGLLFPSILLYIFLAPTGAYPTGQENPLGYINISYVTSIMCLVFGLLSIVGTYAALPRLRKKSSLSKTVKNSKTPKQIFKNFFDTLKKKNYKNVVWGYAISLISSAFITSVGMHLFTYTFKFSTTQITMLMATLFLGTIISQPFWLRMSHKHEKKPTLQKAIITSLFGVGLMALILVFRAGLPFNVQLVGALISLFVSGFGTGALYSLPISMFGDLMTIQYAETNEEKTGTFSGFMTLSYKAANAVALVVIGVLLDVIKFDSSLEGDQPLSVQNGLGAIAVIGIILSLFGSYVIYSGYNIKRKQVNIANAKIAKLHKSQILKNSKTTSEELFVEEE